MKHVKWKSLALYGLTIVAVMVLFKAVTTYGESNLKAASQISDRYRLMFADNLPNCEKLDDMILNIQQSGIYLNGSLLSALNNTDLTSSHQKPSLTGILRNQQLSLSGKVPHSLLCRIPEAEKGSYTHPQNLVTIQLQMLDKNNLAGQITVKDIPKIIKFTATPQTKDKGHK
ncbi:hypothetical protein NIES4075_29920 [Tolypothrix sp. NIES-4075]|uniref:hypothetical protein n=1 Tax=Tolypothrix sp. NIES-4075 TaxID=2005459 RepID=UPI000B5CBF37|nr:hypothetical protein [Tolypothrix sp. NIES-4075]GAX41994.1 hypothetical protein NIES4075_29920 [Tolypothrix sp. NIES-4075]